MRKFIENIFFVAALLVNPDPGFTQTNSWNPMQYQRIDIHTHFYADRPFIIPILDAMNIKRTAILQAIGMDNDDMRLEYEKRILEVRDKYPERFVFCATIDVSHIDDPDYAEQVLAHLEENISLGIAGIKIWKILGMVQKGKDGKYIPVDDKRLDPIWSKFAEYKLPVIMHIADPIDGWRPLDPASPHYGYYKNNPEFHFHGRTDVFQHEELMAQRNSVVAKFPDIHFIGNHIGSMAANLDLAAEVLDNHANFNVELGGRYKDLINQDREKVRAFFINYQDRILYGSDFTVRPAVEDEAGANKRRLEENIERYTKEFRYLETADSIKFGHFIGQGLALPPAVLQKIYWDNPKRLIPGL